MTDGVLLVNFGALQQVGVDIQTALNALQTDLGTLEEAAERLMGSWDGEAKEAYYQRQRRWSAASADLQAILRDIKLAVDDSAADYLSTEKSNTSLFH